MDFVRVCVWQQWLSKDMSVEVWLDHWWQIQDQFSVIHRILFWLNESTSMQHGSKILWKKIYLEEWAVVLEWHIQRSHIGCNVWVCCDIMCCTYLTLLCCCFSPGREYSIPSPLQRLLAEMVDFFILFFIKATIIISIMHLSGIKWVCLISPCSGGEMMIRPAFLHPFILLCFQGCFQVCHAFYSGGNWWRHIDGGATENDACCTCVSDISVFLWGEYSIYSVTQIVIQVMWDKMVVDVSV